MWKYVQENGLSQTKDEEQMVGYIANFPIYITYGILKFEMILKCLEFL